MLSPIVSWFLSPSSSSSSGEEEEEESLEIHLDESDYANNIVEDEDQKDNTEDAEKDQFLSCDVDDDTIPIALAASDASPAMMVAFPAARDDTETAATTTTTATPAANNHTETAATITTTATTILTRSKRRQNTKNFGSVRPYQRLWTKQDEMELLKGYLDCIKQQGGASTSLQYDVALLYDQVMPKLNAGFNRNQLVEKLRRLKRKHKIALDKGKEVAFKSPEEQAIFEISNKIWGNDIDHDVSDADESRQVSESPDKQVDNCDELDKRVSKRLRFTTDDVNTTKDQNNGDASTSIHGFIEETMRSCFSPMLKELLADAPEEPAAAAALPMRSSTGEVEDEEWKKQTILELEVYLNRLELLQGQIKARLEELRSSLG